MDEEEIWTSAAAIATAGAAAAPSPSTTAEEFPMHMASTAANTAPPEVRTPTTTQEETEHRYALAAFLQAPSLREPTHLHMGDRTFLLHLLLDSPGTLSAISRISPPSLPLRRKPSGRHDQPTSPMRGSLRRMALRRTPSP